MAVITVRTLIIFIMLILFMRLLGKRQMGEMELNELVVSVLIADLASLPLQDVGIPLINGIIPVIILFACELILSGTLTKSIRLRSLICGKPSMIIKNGVVQQQAMRESRLTADELAEDLRSQGIIDISQVKYAVLETNGSLSTIRYEDGDSGYPYTVIDNGRTIEENLKKLGYNSTWLQKRLNERRIKRAEDVFLMIVYDSGRIYCEEVKDKK